MRKFRNIIYKLIPLLALIMMPLSCIINEFEEDPMLAEGKSSVSFDVEFRPLVSVGASTRTTGDAIKHIESLWVLVYKSDGSLYKKELVSDYESYGNTEQNVSDIGLNAPEGSSGFAEEKHCRSTFDMDLPLGKYRIYAVANYNLSSFKGTEDELKSIKLDWNASDISANNPMFGYFTDNEVNTIPSEAPVISINKANKSLHAWVRRAASKVTVSFDGSNLNENVYIYIHTVQIKDIPTSCWLGKDNKPDSKDQLISDGETIYHRSQSVTEETAGLRITKGVSTGGLDVTDNAGGMHHENANSLFFFENRQGNTNTEKGKHQDADGDGKIDHHDGRLETDSDFKDGVPYGSYIEVKGYYVNKTATNASQGPIVYRFMLGKDTEKSCDAERSNHYKLVLRFNKDANNTDWHIEYEPENPEISVASPLYISYIHGEYVDIPVVVRGGTNATLTAEIIENNWAYPGHPYEGRYDYNVSSDGDVTPDGILDEGLWNGFLSLKETIPASTSLADRKTDFEKGRILNYTPTATEDTNDYHYNVRAYTRAINLGSSFSGNNVYVDKERTAKIKFTATVNNKSLNKTIEIIQVRRLVNPAGIWRKNTSEKPFHVVLMETEDENNSTFEPVDSDGPWRAEIIEGDWFYISKDEDFTNDVSTKYITGQTGSNIDFHYKPAGTISSSESRFGVIKVTYHNNTCVHYIFVSQGMAPVAMGASGVNWHMSNVHYNGVDEVNPLLEGSMFRWNNKDAAILSINNLRPGYGFQEIPSNPMFDIYDASGNIITWQGWPTGDSETDYMMQVEKSGHSFTTMTSNGSPATYSNWVELQALERYYGVLYGDNSIETETNVSNAYSYIYESDVKGMRGMFVWDQNRNGNHLFFPIGSTGNGHRKHYDDVAYTDSLHQKSCVLRYAQRHEEMYENYSDAWGRAISQPLYYDLYLRPGAIYWYREPVGLDTSSSSDDNYSHDINYFTFGFDTYGKNPVYRTSTTVIHSDAAFIRCVEP